MSSSPDPLNDDPTFYSPPRSRTSNPRRSLPSLATSSPNKQTFELDVGDRISPHKIRVTVEAGDSDIFANYNSANNNSPLASHARKNRRRIKTTTTTVPVKGLSDAEDIAQSATRSKTGRRRPRKSTGTPVSLKKRGRVCTPKPSSSRKSFGEVDEDEDDSTFSLGRSIDREVSRSQSRPRKAPQRKAGPVQDITSSSTAKKGRGRRRKSAVEDMTFIAGLGDASTPRKKPQASVTEAGDALLSVDADDPSAHTNNRSFSSVGEDEGDVVIARFNPGNETPRETGWSSPRTLNAPEQSDVDVALQGQPPSPARDVVAAYDDDTIAASSRRGSHTSLQDVDYDIDDNGKPEQDVDNGEYREFDTIMESEGFSMISIDSVPSLQKHRSSPGNQNDEKEPKKQSRIKSLLSVMETATGVEDSFGSIPEDILEAASPQRKPPKSRPNESYSKKKVVEIPGPELSAQKSHVSRLLSVNNSRLEDSFSSIAPDVLEAATPGRARPQKKPMARTIKQDDVYEDSFSAIPGSILEAATPAVQHQLPFDPKTLRPVTGGSDKLGMSGLKKSLFPSQIVNNTSPRMLTPEETPPPPPPPPPQSPIAQVSALAGEISVPDESTAQDDEDQIRNESSVVYSQMASSPPSVPPRRYTYTAHLRQQRQLHSDIAETPSIVFSSPNLPPLLQPPRQQIGHAQGLSESTRPTLSPIARTGRALQDVEIPVSSPRSRSQSLGSPFKSPAASRTSSSGHRGSRVSHDSPRPKDLPQVSLNANFVALVSENSQGSRSIRQDDPFSNCSSTRPSRSPSLQDKEQYSLQLPEKGTLPSSRVSAFNPNFSSLRSEDAMSWQAEEEISVRSKPSLTSKPLASEERWAAERAEVSRKITSATTEEVIIINSDGEAESYEDDDEDFGLLLETMESSSPASNQTPAKLEPIQPKEFSEKPRRSKIPSPWRKNSKRLVYSDELTNTLSAVDKRPSFAGDIIDGLASNPITARRVLIANHNGDDLDDEDLSGWQIPQKTNFQPRARAGSAALDLSALLGHSPPNKLPVLSTMSNPSSLLACAAKAPQSMVQASIESPEGDTSRSDCGISFTPIPQKIGFAPRARSEVSQLMESSPAAQPKIGLFGNTLKDNSNALAGSSNRANLPISSSSSVPCSSSLPYDGSSSVTSSAEKENKEIDNRTLKWTETVRLSSTERKTPPPLISPTKSCLRSPVKTLGMQPGLSSPTKAVQFISSSPIPPSPQQPLSATTWSKEHWLLLEEILKEYDPRDQSITQANVYDKGRRHSTRVVSKLLGRTVHSDGDSMVMEQWHLEVVDEFRGRVPGWEEKVIAMRVFALIVGGRRRRISAKQAEAEEMAETEDNAKGKGHARRLL